MGRENFPRREKPLLEIQEELDKTRRLYSLESAKGKTISNSIDDEQLMVLMFSDGTFLTFQAVAGYEGEKHISNNQMLDKNDYLKLGLITEKDFKEIKAEAHAELKRRRHQSYEQLKKEFGEQNGI